MTHRLLPPTATAQQTIVVSGRTYSSTPGNAVDVPDLDSVTLQANGWILVALSGPTSGRPTETEISASSGSPLSAGLKFFDTTIGKVIVFDGATWRDPANGNAV